MPNMSVKMDESTRQRLQEVAAREGMSPHAFMLKAIGEGLAQAEAQESFVARALAARDRVVAGGSVIDGPAFAQYLRQRVRGQAAERPAAQEIAKGLDAVA